MKTEKLKYVQILERNAIISAIPCLEYPELSSRIVLAKVAYGNKSEEFNKFMREDVVAKLKPEGFDEQSRKIRTLEEVREKIGWIEPTEKYPEKPELPSKEDMDIADEAKAFEEEYKATMERIEADYQKANAEKLEEEVEMKDYRLTMEEFEYFAKVTSAVKEDRVYNVGTMNVKTEHFLMIIGSNFVREED